MYQFASNLVYMYNSQYSDTNVQQKLQRLTWNYIETPPLLWLFYCFCLKWLSTGIMFIEFCCSVSLLFFLVKLELLLEFWLCVLSHWVLVLKDWVLNPSLVIGEDNVILFLRQRSDMLAEYTPVLSRDEVTCTLKVICDIFCYVFVFVNISWNRDFVQDHLIRSRLSHTRIALLFLRTRDALGRRVKIPTDIYLEER